MLLVLTGVIVACSSSSSNDAPAQAMVTPRVDSGACINSACCELPVPGTLCSAEAGTTCAYAVTCPEGLVLSRSTTCEASVWKPVNDCPAAGAFDARGCPAAQPINGTPCAVDAQSGFAQCGYTKVCMATSCDAGVCVPIRASAQATCQQGVWQTTPIGPC